MNVLFIFIPSLYQPGFGFGFMETIGADMTATLVELLWKLFRV